MTTKNHMCFAIFALVVVATLLAGAKEAQAAECKVSELGTCADDFQGWRSPGDQCCVKLKEQNSCLCNYRSDPKCAEFLDNSPRSKKFLGACKVKVNCSKKRA